MSPVTFDNPDTVAAFEADFGEAVAFHGLDESHRDIFRDHWARNPHWHGDPDAVEQFAQFAMMLKDARDPESPLARFARSSEPTPPTSPTVPPPPTLDKDGLALYRTVEEHSFADKVDFFVAFGKVTKNPEFAAPRPVARPLGEEATPESKEEDRLAQELMRSHAIDYLSAVELVRHTKELAEAKKGPEPTDVPWLDTRPLSAPPRPWAAEDWERDKRRARAAGLVVEYEHWQAAAEQGRDLVGEEAEKARADRVAELEAWSEKFVRGAQKTEAELRAQAIEAELDRRAKTRLKSRGQRAA